MADPSVRLPLLCGALAGPLFTVTYLVEGVTRAHYRPLRHPVSSLALGDAGWTQGAAFLAAGLLTLAFATGLRRASGERAAGASVRGPLLVGAWGVGLLCAGTFVTDPVGGYPSGTPDRVVDASVHGVLHDLFSFAGFVALTAACLVFARMFARAGARGWALYSVASGVLFAGTMVLASRAYGQDAGLADVGGLLQRVALTIGWTWQTLLAVRLLGQDVERRWRSSS
ncbi:MULTISPECIES: DUF998 domain-containing protein [Thermomonosporaceae]|uniref:DUF998 domain-containing protein n=1 Tax=Thermomonosporaceae TaxID=2012 RepID=UPI00255B2F0A|nr:MULTISPECIES: DUF998 domain-containing protein [Thermomonosporaceae]MDL4772594.1 DUF998 domain-containing protein [Actinomadura xylanilytica]